MLWQIILTFCFEKPMCEKLKWAVTVSVKCLAHTWAKPVPVKVVAFITGSCILHKAFYFLFQDPGLFVNLTQVNGVHPECGFQLEIHKEETRCMELLKNAKPVDYKGKKKISCKVETAGVFKIFSLYLLCCCGCCCRVCLY